MKIRVMFSKAGVLSEGPLGLSALASLMLWAGSFLGGAAAACRGSMLSSAPSSTRCSGQSDMSPDFAKSHFPRGQLSSAPFENH